MKKKARASGYKQRVSNNLGLSNLARDRDRRLALKDSRVWKSIARLLRNRSLFRRSRTVDAPTCQSEDRRSVSDVSFRCL